MNTRSKVRQCSKNTALNYLSNLQRTGDSKQSNKLISHRLNFSKSLYRKDLYAHFGCVNAVEFSDDGEWLASGGDDKRVLLWNVDRTLSNCNRPNAMKGEHNSNIFCLSFDPKQEKLLSAGNDEQVILHDLASGETSDVFLHNEAVYGLSVDPNNQNIFASACDDGRVLIWDTRSPTTDAFLLAECSSAFHAVMHNPLETKLLSTANAKEGVGLWDVRKPRVPVLRYGTSLLNQSAMSVRFNSLGTHLLCLRRRLPPVLYEIQSPQPIASFDHKEYYNSCTMKSCCFAGNDEFVLSGSDDFKLYMWKIPDISGKKGIWVDKAHTILRGHRSIVNQIRYNDHYGIFASSGVEKIIKLWSTFPVSMAESDVRDPDGLRKVYSHEEYINLVLESGQFMTHDYSHHSVQEDPRMIAFFDSLVQRDIEGWTSDSSDNGFSTTDAKGICYEVQSSGSSSSDTDSSSSSSSDENFPPYNSQSRQTERSSGFNFSTSLCPAMPSPAAGNICADHANLTSDKISELIAKKRRDQMIKTDKAARRLRKKLGQIRKHIKTRVHGTSINENYSLSNTRSSVTTFSKKHIDKRKLLQKKRVRYIASKLTDDDSSDTDMELDNVNKKVRIDSSSKKDNHSMQSSSDSKNDAFPIASISSVTSESPCSSKDVSNNNNLSIPHCSTTSPMDDNGSTSSVPSRPNNSLFSQPKKGRHHCRNYRKRSKEDLQDEA